MLKKTIEPTKFKKLKKGGAKCSAFYLGKKKPTFFELAKKRYNKGDLGDF
jgi:hypothetical protein